MEIDLRRAPVERTRAGIAEGRQRHGLGLEESRRRLEIEERKTQAQERQIFYAFVTACVSAVALIVTAFVKGRIG